MYFSAVAEANYCQSLKHPLRKTGPKESEDVGKVISVIGTGNHGFPSVFKHMLDGGTQYSHAIPRALGYWYITKGCTSIIDHSRLPKMLTKSTASLERLASLLHMTSNTNELNQVAKMRVCNMDMGESHFLTQSQSSHEAKFDAAEVFAKVGMRYNNGLVLTQYFNPHCGEIKSHMLTGDLMVQLKGIEINTGMCLFSKAVLSSAKTQCCIKNYEDKLMIPELPSNANLTLYELETIARLSSAITDTIGICENTCTSRMVPIHVNIDIPDFQYYWVACKLFASNLVGLSYVQEWIEAIDNRRRQLMAIMTSLIRSMLLDRELSPVKVNLTPGTEPASALIKRKIVQGTIPNFEEIVCALKFDRENPGQWSRFLEHLCPRYHPQTVEDLGRSAYVFKAARSAFLDSGLEKDDCGYSGTTLMLQIDDINEWKVLKQVQMFLKNYCRRGQICSRKVVSAGLFPMQRIVTTNPGRSCLFNHDPGQQLTVESGSSIIGPLEIIGITYGCRTKELLQKACFQHGYEGILG